MGKVLRLHETGSNNIQDWGETQPYGYNEINGIQDPNGSLMGLKVTSIPSPFAVIDLVKTAFREVVDSGDLDGATEYHRMVSDAMDVAEIFFNYNKFKEDIEIIECSRDDIKNMGGTIGETLRTYMEQDAESYNFNDFGSFFLLNYKRGPKPMNIIGSTSPATLFFAPANDLSYASDEIRFANGDNPFDRELQPLYKRDIELVKYLWLLMKQSVNGRSVSTMMPEVNKYLEATYGRLDTEKKQQLNEAVRNQDMSSYSPLQINNSQIELLSGLSMHIRPQKPLKGESDFEIKSSIYTGAKPPLVLPSEKGSIYENMTYTPGNLWGRNDYAPQNDPRPLTERTLPNEGTQYPYISIGDLLEERIIRMEGAQIDKSRYFDGGIEYCSNSCKNSFLLPLKRAIFDYFTPREIEDLVKMEPLPTGGVSVTLRIPVKCNKAGKSFIVYKKDYSAGDDTDDYIFTFAMMPHVRFANPDDAKYRVAVTPQEGCKPSEIDLKFFNKTGEIQSSLTQRCEDYENDVVIKAYAVEGQNIDFIELKHDGLSGIILPKLKEQKTSNTRYSFAIDLGSSNTHIEYLSDSQNDKSRPFDITEDDAQISFIYEDTSDVNLTSYNHIIKEFIPELIGSETAKTKFPLSTALSVARNINWNTAVTPFSYTNAFLTYDKYSNNSDSKTLTNIKWDRSEGSGKHIEAYIGSLFFLIRNKVVLSGGDLKATKVTWFYPVSMNRSEINRFDEAWKKAYSENIGGDCDNLMKMTESVAPYLYNKGRYGQSPIATIDIGGGTTDVVFGNNGQIEAISSFRFASNNIYNNGYELQSVSDDDANITSLFKNGISKTLDDNDLTELSKIINERKGSDLVSFLFSLSQDIDVKQKKLTDLVDFNKKLRDDENVKIIYLLFYFSIMYHVANIIKAKGLNLPEIISFSGNGSKILSIITTDTELLCEFTKEIIETVSERKYGNCDFRLNYGKPDSYPKELTCKGALTGERGPSISDTERLKIVLKGDNSGIVGVDDTYANISEELKNGTVAEVKKMLDIFFRIGEGDAFNFNKNFGVSVDSLKTAKDVCYKGLEGGLRNGIAQHSPSTKDDKRNETMFFYPLVETLNRLSKAICEALNK